jgi:hypothetical protein
MGLSPRDIALTSEVMAYFADRQAQFPPSQIDWVMGLEKGKAHDIIVRKWAIDKANAKERLSDYHE